MADKYKYSVIICIPMWFTKRFASSGMQRDSSGGASSFQVLSVVATTNQPTRNDTTTVHENVAIIN